MDAGLHWILAIGFAGAVGVVSMLFIACSDFLRAIAVHELKVETARLHAEHAKRIADLKRGRMG